VLYLAKQRAAKLFLVEKLEAAHRCGVVSQVCLLRFMLFI